MTYNCKSIDITEMVSQQPRSPSVNLRRLPDIQKARSPVNEVGITENCLV